MKKINKKGAGPISVVWALFLAVFLIIFFSGGGISSFYSITKFLTQIPTFVWVILGIVFLFKLISKKK